MNETALNFGASGALVGILTRSAGAGTERPVSEVAVVFLNAGILHRVGPNRVHVRLARRLAEHGVPSLRLDLPGIGDSRSTDGTLSFGQEALQAVRAAFDLLEERRVARRFVVFGLCSGADYGFQITCADSRAVGVCLIDPSRLVPTWKARSRWVLGWVTRPVSWFRLLSGRYGVWSGVRRWFVGRWPGGPGSTSRGETTEPARREVKEAARARLKTLADRQVRICCVVTGDQRRVYNYRTQLLDAFPGLGLERLARLEILPDAEHTFPGESHRKRLEEIVVEWVTSTDFASGANGSRGDREAPLSAEGSAAAMGSVGGFAPMPDRLGR